ncbi:RNA methyltransferase [Parapedobacter deserti]|uniref:RNA methyltransferase n=1 Tax=Parapedobacter deserti TaxID=1912957 RepID=A0ABV7JKN8_9SPHI
MQKLSMDQLQRPSVELFKAQAKLPVALVLDNVRSMHNVGSAFRTSDAFALEKVALCGITGTPPHREIEKTALGATQSVAWTYAADPVSAIRQLQEDGYRIVAVEQAQGSIPLQEFVPKAGEKYALVFGNEVHGVSNEIMALADACIEIPQSGTKHSLNIAVSIGIVLWSFYASLHINARDEPK